MWISKAEKDHQIDEKELKEKKARIGEISDRLVNLFFDARNEGFHSSDIYWGLCYTQAYFEECMKNQIPNLHKISPEKLKEMAGYRTVEEVLKALDEIAKAEVDKDRPLGWFKK